MQSGDAAISITFRGVRGSHPMPGPTTLRYGGNTASQEIRAGGRLLIFDAGTGIISLGREMSEQPGPHDLAVFFTHSHHDHIGGILYFRPAYMSSTTMHIFGHAENSGDIMDALERLSQSAAHPVQLVRMGMTYRSTILQGGETVLWREDESAPRLARADECPTPRDVAVRVMRNHLHPIGGVLNFRLECGGKSYVYATDVEGDEETGDQELAAFARGADLLAHDGQYTSEEYHPARTGWGHSTVAMAVRTASMSGVRRLAIIHHDPEHDDNRLDAMEKEAQAMFPGTFLAREGQTVVL